MNIGRTVEELQRLLAFLAKASVDRVIPHAQISHFSPDALVSAGEHLADRAFLVLNGRCEHRHQPTDGGTQVLKTFNSGETFGGLNFISPEKSTATVVAAEDSVVLHIRLDDLANIARESTGAGLTAPVGTSELFAPAFSFAAPKGRLVTLAFLSDTLPAQLLSDGIARRLRAETGESVALVRFVPGPHVATNQREPVDCRLNGYAELPGELRENDAGFHLVRVGIICEPPSPEAVGELLENLRRRFRHVLVTVTAEHLAANHLFDCVEQSSAAYLFLRRADEDLRELELLLRELRPRLNRHVPVGLKPVLCLAENETVAGFDARVAGLGISLHGFSVRGCPMLTHPREPAAHGNPVGSFHPDVRRLAREMGGCLVGLALSSGGPKGFTHIGVMQVLEENGIEVDVVAGASMGAYVGSIWAFGCDGPQMEKLAREMEGRWALWSLIDPAIPPRQGFLRGYAARRRLQRTIGETHFADLVRPLRVVATNLATLERTVFASGVVADAVHASMAVPGICVPVRIGDEVYVDGGIVDPLPTDVLQEMGIRRIIAVNANPTPDRIRESVEAGRAHARQLAPNEKSIVRLSKHVNYFARGNILDILMRSIHGAQIRVAESGCQRASIVLRPEICSDNWVDFRIPSQHIKAGRVVAAQHLDQIKALVRIKGTSHESEPFTESLAAVA